MSMSTKVFAQQSLANFERLTEEIQRRQERVATGVEVNKTSDAPLDAVKVSAADQRLRAVERYLGNIQQAETRLNLTDSALESVSDIMTRLNELAIRAASDTLTAEDKNAIRLEAQGQREALVGIANSRDLNDQALFGGYSTENEAFVTNEDGSVVFAGDSGTQTIPVSGTLRVPLGLNGADAFQQVVTENGKISVFDAVDSFINALAFEDEFATTGSAETSADIAFVADTTPQNWSVRIEGPDGGVQDISFTIVSGNAEAAYDAINEVAASTGVSAVLSDDGRTVSLSASGSFTLSNIEIEGIPTAGAPPSYFMELTDDEGVTSRIAPSAQSLSSQITLLARASDSIALNRAVVGSRLNQVEQMDAVMTEREIFLAEDISNLRDADIQQTILELQELLTNRDAARQAYSLVTQRSLFDYIS